MANKDISQTEKSQANDPNGKGRNKKVKKKKSKYKKIFKGTFLTILILCLLLGVVLLGYVFAIIKSTPELDVNKVLSLSEPSMLFDDAGEFIDNLPTDQNREIIEYEQIPKILRDAYISIEDERFEEHIGIDIKRTIGSALRSAIFVITGDGNVQGGSTLTQQLIKNTLLTNEVKVERKIKEIYLSISLENKLSKEQILQAYLNTIPLGSNVYGVEAASKYFFEKPAMELTLPEAAFIAGLTQAPTSYSPYYPDNIEDPTVYLDRTKTVLMKMRDLGKITLEEYQEAYNFTDKNLFEFSQTVTSYKIAYEWFVYPALDQVRNDLKEVYKYTDEEVDKLFANGGLKIYTTMNTKMQNSTQAVLDNRDNYTYIDIWNNPEEFDENGTPYLQASATVIDYRTGQVKVLIGGRGEQPALSTNRAYDTLRSIGSTTKPLTVYGPAINTNTITVATPLYDGLLPQSIRNAYPGWTPTNWNNVSDGIITSREAIALSKNIASITVADKIGIETGVEYGEKLGVVYSEPSKALATVALGEFESDPTDPDGGNTFILAGAYGTFANNGLYTEPILYTKVVDSTGKVILDKTPKQTQVFSPQTAYIMRDLLKGPITFDGSSARLANMPVIGKTGTTNSVTDFLFAGLTPYYSGSVWIGYDDNSVVGGSSYSGSAANLWGLIMSPIHADLEYKNFDGNPGGVVSVAVCQDSGHLAGENCAHDQRGSRVRTELFISGTEPKTTCDVHVKAKVNKENNKLATNDTPFNLIEEKVFVKVAEPYRNAADFKYTLPTEKDNTKARSFKLSDLNIKVGTDVDLAISILKDKGITLEITNPTALTRTIKSISSNSVKQGDTVKVKLEDIVEVPETPTIPETPPIPEIPDPETPVNEDPNNNPNNNSNNND